MSDIKHLFTDKQLDVLKCSVNEEPRILVTSGAKRAGKTFILNHAFIMHMEGFKNLGVNFIIGGASISTIQRNVLDDLEKMLDIDIKLDKKNSFELWGNTVYCFGGANSDSWKSARGFTSAGAFLNEGTALHDSFVKEVISRCSYNGARVFIDTNPENPMHPVKTDYIDKNETYLKSGKLNVKAFHFTLYDNNFLPQDYIEGIEATTPTGMYYDRDILGLWVSAEGVVYKDFDERKHVIDSYDKNQVRRYFGAVDWGYEHAGAFCIFAETFDNKCIMVECHKHQHKLVEGFWLELFKDKHKEYRLTDIYCDTARPEYVYLLNRETGVGYGANKEVVTGIETVARMFKTERFHVLKECSNQFLNEIYTYTYKPNSDEPVKINDDVLKIIGFINKKSGKKSGTLKCQSELKLAV